MCVDTGREESVGEEGAEENADIGNCVGGGEGVDMRRGEGGRVTGGEGVQGVACKAGCTICKGDEGGGV